MRYFIVRWEGNIVQPRTVGCMNYMSNDDTYPSQKNLTNLIIDQAKKVNHVEIFDAMIHSITELNKEDFESWLGEKVSS